MNSIRCFSCFKPYNDEGPEFEKIHSHVFGVVYICELCGVESRASSEKRKAFVAATVAISDLIQTTPIPLALEAISATLKDETHKKILIAAAGHIRSLEDQVKVLIDTKLRG